MKRWPHAPSRAVIQPGTYIITASTYNKLPVFKGQERLTLLHDLVLEIAEQQGWQLNAWAVFPNHYHLVGHSPQVDDAPAELTKRIHGNSARRLNNLENARGRMVWFRSWPTLITFEKSFLARLAYVHRNAVHHGLVAEPEDYPFCSANWFARGADRPFFDTVMSFKTDTVNVIDDFSVDGWDE